MPSFDGFYRAVHRYTPFPWQSRLAERAAIGDWPATLAVPTGCGKTSMIDIAVWALASQARRPAKDRTAPLRTFFVVDRRLVVDDAFEHATKLADALEHSEQEDAAWVREQLKQFGGSRPLHAAVLRGGMYRSNTWADAPNQPLICSSTVDQVGSRLLFRGYGVSEGQRPVQAGLIGNDSLIIVDEAHLSKPFLQTVERVRKYQSGPWRVEKGVPGLRLLEMSATVANPQGAFHLAEDDFACDALRTRLEAVKSAGLADCANLTEASAKEAVRLADEGCGVVGVVLNTVAAARTIFEGLRAAGEEAILLTGRVRPFDRDRILDKYLGRMKAGRMRPEGERLFVVATQTVEVGADLDFDGLVTEAAPLDCLRQRFGRLNRLGRAESSPGVILRQKRTKEKDWVYGEPEEKTWEWLNQHATGGRIDFGVARMGEMFQAAGDSCLLATSGVGPLLLPAHVDAWVQTKPAPAADPDIAPFLHGAVKQSDVQIVWRADLEDVPTGDWTEMLEAAPPLSAEALAVPIGAAARWLREEAAPVADVEGREPNEDYVDEPGGRRRLIWRGPENSTADGDPRPGDTIVVRSSEGGCDEFGWNPGSVKPVRDIGDLCANERARSGGGKYRIRVHPDVLFPGPERAEFRERVRDLLEGAGADDEDASMELEELVKGIAELQEAAEQIRWSGIKSYGPSGRNWLIGESRRMKPVLKKPATVELDESADGDTASFTTPMALSKHTEGVVGKARQFGGGCGLDDSLLAAIVGAAERHDLGKWDERFQFILSPSAKPEPLAKGDGCSRSVYMKRREQSGYPEGARHEFTSVALAESANSWMDGCDTDLALYLIGTHHGYGRPFAPVWKDGDYEITGEFEGRTVSARGTHRVAALDSGWTERFWRLTRKYGWWGLAYLEAILRRADCVRSREEEEGAI